MMDYDAAMAELRRVCNGERAEPPAYEPEIDPFAGERDPAWSAVDYLDLYERLMVVLGRDKGAAKP